MNRTTPTTSRARVTTLATVVLPERWQGLHEPSVMCWCRPTVERYFGRNLVMHNNPGGDLDTDWVVVSMEHEVGHAVPEDQP